MKDTILNSILIAAAFSAILLAVIDDLQPATQTAAVQANRVVEMGKTVVAAKRLPADVMLVASAGQ